MSIDAQPQDPTTHARDVVELALDFIWANLDQRVDEHLALAVGVPSGLLTERVKDEAENMLDRLALALADY